ncbi:maleate cis-trans isomerase family protein [Cryobacterium tepidiphilum]|jgi:maleate cis-trans isomerase|nr:aspartate/glutamate racemase family protein [Cryobacterium tepidiphilum]
MKAEFGWRGRVGLILPADNVVMEPELGSLAVPGVSFHGLRMTSTVHEQMRQQAIDLGGVLDEMGVDVAVYACAETSFNAGAEMRENLSSLIADNCRVPVVTATNAMLEAIAAVGMRRASVVTPYAPGSGALFESTLREHGVDVLSATHRDFRLEGGDPREWFHTNRQDSRTVREMARAVVHPDADGLIVSATNFPALGAVQELEAELGIPVVTSNQSILWWCLTRLGLDTAELPLHDLGRLFAEPLSAAGGGR